MYAFVTELDLQFVQFANSLGTVNTHNYVVILTTALMLMFTGIACEQTSFVSGCL